MQVGMKFIRDKWKQYRTVALVISAIVIYSFYVWWPSRYYPYFWDSSGFVVHTVETIRNSNFVSLVGSDTNFAHPTLFMVILAAIWQIVGPSPLVSHWVMFPFLPMLLISTYFIARKYLAFVPTLLAVAVVAATPVVLAEYANVYVDLPSAAVANLALALFIWNHTIAAVVALSIAVLIKLPMVLLLAFPIYSLWLTKSLKTKGRVLAIPFAVIGVWLLYHLVGKGWLLVEPGRPLNVANNLFNSFLNVSIPLLIEQARWAISIPALIGVFVLASDRKIVKQLPKYPELGLLANVMVGMVFFSIMGEFGARYGIFLLPSLVVVSLWLAKKAFDRYWPELSEWGLVSIGALAVLAASFSAHPQIPLTNRYEFAPPDDLSYHDMLKVFRQMALYIEMVSPEAEVYGGFPENQQLTEPIQGYVSKPLQFEMCKNFSFKTSVLQLVYVHPYSPTQIDCRLLMEKYDFQPVTQYQSNGKWVELYEVTATRSAEASKSAEINAE